jgi:hypothetical protein
MTRQVWTSAGATYLLLCLGATGIGIWPDAIYPREHTAAPLPTLQILTVTQLAWFLLVWPLVALRRSEPGPRCDASVSEAEPSLDAPNTPTDATGPSWADTLLEWLVLLAATTPFYLTAGWLADATVADVVRTVLLVISFWPMAMWMTALILRPWGRAVALLLGLGFTAAGAMLVYFALEYISTAAGHWLWEVLPVGLTWQATASRQPWATLDWRWGIAPVLGILGLLAMQLPPRKASACDYPI